MRKKTRGIIIPPETRTGVKRLSQEQKGYLLDAIYAYNIDGEIVEMDTSVGIVFDMMKDFFDINIENYEKISEQNAEKMRNRWEKVQSDTTVYNGIQQNTTATNKEKKRKENINKEKEIEIKTETDIPIGIGSQAITVSGETEIIKIDHRNAGTQRIIEIIKDQVQQEGLFYDNNPQERNRATIIAKRQSDWGAFVKDSSEEYEENAIRSIIAYSNQNEYSAKIRSARDFHEKWKKVANDMKTKSKKEQETSFIPKF